MNLGVGACQFDADFLFLSVTDAPIHFYERLDESEIICFTFMMRFTDVHFHLCILVKLDSKKDFDTRTCQAMCQS